MLQTPTYRPCPACASEQASPIAAYSHDEWSVTAGELVVLRNPPAYEALEEDFAWKKSYIEKKQASKGSIFLSTLVRRVKEKTKLFMRDRDTKMRICKDGSALDVGCRRPERRRSEDCEGGKTQAVVRSGTACPAYSARAGLRSCAASTSVSWAS